LVVRVALRGTTSRARTASTAPWSRSTTSPTSWSAQRTSAAWADIARRIAHEIKNPLTPIQLSAERLIRRYGKRHHRGPRGLRPVHRHDHPSGSTTSSRMVDEFSSFARMPKPQSSTMEDRR
jgi:two-component system nitrogen regulation sensor histidine kinase NtrY